MANTTGNGPVINGTSGSDVIIGTDGNDLIRGLGSSDTIDGAAGNDFIDAGPGNDTLIGSAGVDWLVGGVGDDLYTGDGGADQFRFYGYAITGAGTATPGHDTDRITDLNFDEGDFIVLGHFAAESFQGTDVNGSLDLVTTTEGPRSGANIRSWAGMVDLVKSSDAVTAARLGTTDTLLLEITQPGGAVQTIAIDNGWHKYAELVNKAPTPAADSAALDEDTTATGNVLANDSDPDAGDALTVSALRIGAAGADQAVAGDNSPLVVAGTYGTLTIRADGSYAYVANSAAAQALAQGQPAQELFTYTAKDSFGATATATLSFAITGQNDAPVAKALAGTVGENATKTFTADFSDVDAGDTHGFAVGTAGTIGKVTAAADGTFLYDTNGKFEYLKAGQTATDSFTYTVSDNHGGSSTQTVSVTVTGANDRPGVLADINGVQKNSTLVVPASKGVLSNDGDPEGDALSVAAVNGSAANVGKAIAGTFGSLTLKADGSYAYAANNKAAPTPAMQVAQDIFTYTTSDGHGGSATTTLTISVQKGGQGYVRGSDCDDILFSCFDNDIVDGGNGNDFLYGGKFRDGLVGGAGNDVLFGGSMKDTFVFNKGFGNDVILDFENGFDVLQFSKSVFASFAAVKAATSVSGSNLVITAVGGDTVTLYNTKLAALDASDFLFV